MKYGLILGEYSGMVDYKRETFNGVFEKAQSLFGLDLDLENLKMLVIGEREHNHMIQEAIDMGVKITIVEGNEFNCSRLKTIYSDIDIINSLIQDYKPSDYDIIWWYHGPEHLEQNEVVPVINKLLDHCTIFLSACPHGIYEQPAFNGNILELHKTHLYPHMITSNFNNSYVFTETDTADIKTCMDIMIKGRL